MFNHYSKIFIFSALFPIAVFCSDWPMYKYDAARSGNTNIEVKFPLELVWRYQWADGGRTEKKA